MSTSTCAPPAPPPLPPSRTPDLAFKITHYLYSPSPTPTSHPRLSPPTIQNHVVYASLPSAQAAAQRLFDTVLGEHHNAGYTGNYYNEIGVHLRGLITAVVPRLGTGDTGRGTGSGGTGSGGTGTGGETVMEEVPLSEILIDAVLVWDERFAPAAGDEEERELNKNGGEVGMRVKLPNVDKEAGTADGEVVSAQSQGADGRDVDVQGPYWPQERRASWAQSRGMLFNRRDDAPFRGEGDKPYDETMGF